MQVHDLKSRILSLSLVLPILNRITWCPYLYIWFQSKGGGGRLSLNKSQTLRTPHTIFLHITAECLTLDQMWGVQSLLPP